MRLALVALGFAATACSQAAAPAETTLQTTANSAPADSIGQNAMMRVIAPASLAGLWSFDKSCGLYDLVLKTDGSAEYYDYADQSHVVTRTGTWAGDGINRIALNLRREGGPAEAFSLDIGSLEGDTLIGDLHAGADRVIPINAKRCPAEDRE